jgi:hypothetical protein
MYDYQFDPDFHKAILEYGVGLLIAIVAIAYSLFALGTLYTFSAAGLGTSLFDTGWAFMDGTKTAPKSLRLKAIAPVLVGAPIVDAICEALKNSHIGLIIFCASCSFLLIYVFIAYVRFHYWPPPYDGYNSDDDSGSRVPPNGGGRLWQVERISLNFHGFPCLFIFYLVYLSYFPSDHFCIY